LGLDVAPHHYFVVFFLLVHRGLQFFGGGLVSLPLAFDSRLRMRSVLVRTRPKSCLTGLEHPLFLKGGDGVLDISLLFDFIMGLVGSHVNLGW